MKNFFFFLLFLTFTKSVLGQTCFHTNLSKEFNFEIKVRKIPANDKIVDNGSVDIVVQSKNSKSKQSFNFGSNFLFDNTFIDCKTVRSYSTGINKNAEVVDNDYGDLIIADFNFDKREDFAIKNNSGGNGGPSYNFYIQNKNKKFILDKFLTRRMEFFPTKFLLKNKELITYVHANAYQLSKNTFVYNVKLNKWKLKDSRLVSY